MPERYYKSLRDLPKEEYLASGHRLCAGCAAGTIIRHLLKVAGPNTIVVTATGCLEVATTPYPLTAWRVPWIHVAFENAASVASGVEAAIKALQRKGLIDPSKRINIIAIGGDGGTYDIGFQALSGMLERGHKVMYLLYDNEAYMNTGIQRSGGTPQFAWTTTTPAGRVWKGKHQPKKPISDIVAAHRIPYVATANPAYVLDMVNKFRRALEVEGPSFVHVIQPCPTGWRFDPSKSIEIAKLATETGMWINWELDHGEFRVTVPVPKRKHVKHYIRAQGRFRHLTDEDIEKIQEYINKEVERINKLVGKEVIGPLAE
ncbi:MAG: pyruvate synthase subunit beta [Crenarchaeota archaeon]|nr:pyruvate synthase subunit beta [Thermoproteota archaeon]